MEGSHRLYPRLPNPWTSPWELTEDNLPPILLAFVVETLFYGMHVILFVLCVRILWKRQRGRLLQILMLGAIVTMFLLATADIAVSWNLVIRNTKTMYRADTLTFFKAIYPKFVLYLLNNAIADILLLVRCYVVWGNSRLILVSGSLMLLVGTVFGIISEATTSPSLKRYIGAYMVIAITLNIIITLLTIGRILFIAREVKLLMGKKMVSHYNFAVGVLVESGLLYSASFILTIALSRTYFILVAAAISIRMVCIVPILLVVQIALGQTTKSVEATVSTLRVTTSPIVLDTIVTVGGEDESESAAHRLPRIEDVESRKSNGHLVG